MKCQLCNCEETIIKEYEKDFLVKGKNLKATIKSRFCKRCDSIIYDETLDEEATRHIIKKYLKEYGIEPEKIISFRKKYNLSQELFAKIIGCAKKTLISYEKGTSIPNETYMIILKTLLDNENVIKPIIEANKEQFTVSEYEKIKNKIYPHIGNNILNLESNTINLNEYNGYTVLSFTKIKNLIIFLVKEGLHKTKLLKELFYADFKCYKQYGYSMTGLEYAKLPFGPVPDNYEIILKQLMEDRVIELKKIINKNYEENIIKSTEEEDLSLFNDDEIKLINNVKSYFKNFTVKDIVEFSHQEQAYIKTDDNQMISYDHSFNLQI